MHLAPSIYYVQRTGEKRKFRNKHILGTGGGNVLLIAKVIPKLPQKWKKKTRN